MALVFTTSKCGSQNAYCISTGKRLLTDNQLDNLFVIAYLLVRINWEALVN